MCFTKIYMFFTWDWIKFLNIHRAMTKCAILASKQHIIICCMQIVVKSHCSENQDSNFHIAVHRLLVKQMHWTRLIPQHGLIAEDDFDHYHPAVVCHILPSRSRWLSWPPFGCSWGLSWLHFGCSWLLFGVSWGSLGFLLGALGRLWGALSGFWIDQKGLPASSWKWLGPRLLASCCRSWPWAGYRLGLGDCSRCCRRPYGRLRAQHHGTGRVIDWGACWCPHRQSNQWLSRRPCPWAHRWRHFNPHGTQWDGEAGTHCANCSWQMLAPADCVLPLQLIASRRPSKTLEKKRIQT